MNIMFKRIITLILSVLMVICFSCAAVNAATSIQSANMSNSTLYFNEPSHYALYIPETIDLSMGYITLQADYMDMLPNEFLSVNLNGLDSNNNITFTHENGKDTVDRVLDVTDDGTNYRIGNDDSYATNRVAYFTGDSTNSHLSFYLGQYYSSEPLKSGKYTADVEFEICQNVVTD